MKTKLFALSFLAIVAFGCNQQSTDGAQSTLTDANATTGAADQATSTEGGKTDEKVNSPVPKSADLQEKHKQQWEDAILAEKALLGSPKLMGWIDGLKSTVDEDGFDQPGKLTDQQFGGLSIQEQLCYYLFHPEEASQNCAMAYFEAGLVDGISKYLPVGGEEYPSERQTKALDAKRGEVVTWTKKCINSNKALSVPLMRTIVTMQMKEVVLPLIDLYNAQSLKDDLILSTIIELMNNDEFAEWEKSDLALQMDMITVSEYGEAAEYVPLTEENVSKLISIAKKYAAS